MESRKVELIVGRLIILCFAILIIFALRFANVTLSSKIETYKLRAQFDNIGGLKVSSPIRMGGVLIGRVTSIKLETESLTPTVTISIVKTYKLPSETEASILTSGLLGEQYLSLSPGGDDKILKNGEWIKDTQSALIFEELIGQFLFNDVQDHLEANE